ncbi:porin family protein [Compostibacter hankyongensis]|uniref:Outer membrane protein beta-barrel domain-containing protein n=1 Tax=Compostibacter hankyongensis TaxID=1007089 RepID=A0ABP8GA79_9BACT
MKKSLCLWSLCLGLLAGARTSHAQQATYIGVKGGISIPNLSSGSGGENDWNKNYTSRVGPYFGALAEFQFSPLFSLQPEINYAAEGGKRSGKQPFTVPDEYKEMFQQAFPGRDYVYADFNNVSRINYLQVPVMGKFNFSLSRNGKLKLFAQVGPYIGFLVSAHQIVHSDHVKVYINEDDPDPLPDQAVETFFGSTKLDTSINARDELHKVNWGIQGGIGLSLDCGRGKFFIEGGGNYGFMDIQKGDEHGKNHIGAATILAGYALELRRKGS